MPTYKTPRGGRVRVHTSKKPSGGRKTRTVIVTVAGPKPRK